MNAWLPAGLLGALALLQMGADLAGLERLKGFAAATAASPAPKVFSAVGKLETYAVGFVLEWTDEAGNERAAAKQFRAALKIAGVAEVETDSQMAAR